MQTSNYEKLKVYISGYGPFMDIVNNPSNVLVDEIMRNKNNFESKLNNLCEINDYSLLIILDDCYQYQNPPNICYKS